MSVGRQRPTSEKFMSPTSRARASKPSMIAEIASGGGPEASPAPKSGRAVVPGYGRGSGAGADEVVKPRPFGRSKVDPNPTTSDEPARIAPQLHVRFFALGGPQFVFLTGLLLRAG